MKKIIRIITVFIILVGCKVTTKKHSDGQMLSIDSLKVPEMSNLYSWKDSVVPLSEFIDSICKVSLNKYSLDEIPENILTNEIFRNFKVDLQQDTIFIKRERLYYRWLIPKFKEQYFVQMLVWNKNQLIYIDDQNNDLLKVTDTSADEFRNKYTDFLQLIEQWRRRVIYVHSTDTYKRYSHRSDANKGVDRIVINRGKVKINHIDFSELRFNNNLTKNYLMGDKVVVVPMNYHVMIEDYYGFRNSLTSDPYREIKDTMYYLDFEPGYEPGSGIIKVEIDTAILVEDDF